MAKTKINKARIKRAIRPPSNAVVMSMMAVILVCAAPALVSIIDDSDKTIIHTADGLNFKDSDISNYSIPFWKSDTPVDLVKTYAASDIGSIVYSFDSPEASDYVRVYEIRNLDFSDKGLTKIDVSVSEPIDSIRLKVDSMIFYDFAKISDTDYSLDVNQITALNLASGDRVAVLIYTLAEYDYGSGFVVDSSTYYGTTIAYGEIIIGGTGVLLMVCALLATPWFGVGGITKKKRRA